MNVPALETKPKFRTTTTAVLFDIFEVQLVVDGVGQSFEPRHDTAYTQEDAVLKLAGVLKHYGITPDEFMETLGDRQLIITHKRIAEIDGKFFRQLSVKAPLPHASIISRIVGYYPHVARISGADALNVIEAVQEEEVPAMTSMANSGSLHGRQEARPAAAPKPRKVTTVYGSGETKQDQMATLLTQMKPEDIGTGVVLVMGKKGPSLRKTAGGMTEEEAMEALIDGEEGDGEEETQEIHIPLDSPAPGRPAAPRVASVTQQEPDGGDDEPVAPVRRVPKVAVMSAEAAERMAVTPVTLPHIELLEGTTDADTAEMNAMLAQQLEAAPAARTARAVSRPEHPERVSRTIAMAAEADEAAQEIIVEDEHASGRRIQRQDIVRRDRGQGAKRPEKKR